MITIVLNGQSTGIEKGLTVQALVERYPISPKTILIEKNGEALHRSEWKELILKSGDRIEFIKVVAGG